LRNINKAVDTLDFGGIIVNDYPTFRVDNQPYGGVKLSGRGREGLKYAIRDMAEIKTVIFRNLE
jgi:acyl-CoA reductase-like NAD-dependent aldehyde dehydrogenase